ncbi:penicillin-binding protein 2 [Salinibacterium sp. G-O1]|uniref:peptidoglycan D,D-transpeptidase FtsI family protein n=1 Tax=Salinibacterium sp. G-O1 TaxID=3046208 RepID=UPI0024B9B01F|nr:penicillin-binding protein 2 [Salinibacterium sp. G-O1]MDJ0334987.1 penicillin-binding protein 2 [Salinibacterium sp. G-O1]
MRTRSSRARISLAVLVVFVIVGVFVVRLVDIQVVRAEELNAASLDKRGRDITTYGVRGDIVDANGAVLADSVLRYDITASPRVALLPSDAATSVPAQLAELAAITKQDPAALYASITEDPTSDFMYLVKGVTLDVFEQIDALDISWIYPERKSARSYPNGEIAGNLVGFIGTDGPQAGLELTEDECLASDNGTITYEKGEDGTALPGSEVVTKQSKDGGTLRLTIDRDLQFYVQQRMEQTALELGATWATAVVIRVADGHLMSVADWPTLDPNNVDDASRDALGSRAFSTPYEPGSTMKALTAASLVDSGAARPGDGVVVPYELLQADGSSIHDAFYHETQNLTLAGALVESSNVAVAQFTDRLPAQKRHDYMAAFGLGQYTEVDFNGESAGQLSDADQWFGRTNYAVQYGQGMSATSVQMASVFQTIGNQGVRMPVTLVAGCELADGTMTDVASTEGRQVLSSSAADTTVAMMEQVANKSGSAPKLQIPGYRTAVKSGTAEVAVDGGYSDNSVVISYAGVAPADDPQYAVVVTAGIPARVFSGLIAPTWRDVMAQTLTTFRVPPSTSPAPDLPVNW